jgi:hypothetical protein
MMLDREAIEKRKKEYSNTRLVMLQNVAMCDGAIQDCDYWLAELAKLEAEAAEVTKGSGDEPKEEPANAG